MWLRSEAWSFASSRVAASESLFIKGPSGSGKSTLSGLLSGVTTAVAGSVHVMGRELDWLGSVQRNHFRSDHAGLNTQMLNLIPDPPVTGNIILPCRFSARRRANALLIVSALVVIVGLFGMLADLLTSLNERRRKMATLRSVGARPGHIFASIMGGASILALISALFGLPLPCLLLLSAVVAAGFLVGSTPSCRVYRLPLADGLSVRF